MPAGSPGSVQPTALAVPPSQDRDTPVPVVSSLLTLSKARLSLLVVSTTSTGFLAAGYPALASSPSALVVASVGTFLCSCSAGALNQIYEADRDSRMRRTRKRPMVTGALSPEIAKAFALASGAAGTASLAAVDTTAAALGVANIILYAGLYTVSKPVTEWNTWIGAAVGAIPPVMGYCAAGGGMLDPPAIALASALYLWQFPHFMALNWMYREDYARGGYEMVATNDPTGERTAGVIVRYAAALSTIPIICWATDITGVMFVVEGFALNGYAAYVAWKFKKSRTNGNARKVFLCSLGYLPCWMMLFLLHSKTWDGEDEKDGVGFSIIEGAANDIQEKIFTIRDAGRDLCLHEAVINRVSGEDESVITEKNPESQRQ